MVIKKIIKSIHSDSVINTEQKSYLSFVKKDIAFATQNNPDNTDFLNSRVEETYSFSSSEFSTLSIEDKLVSIQEMLLESDLGFNYNFKTQIPTIESLEAANNSNHQVSNYSMVPFNNYYAKQYEEVMTGLTFLDAPNCYVAMKNGIIDSHSSHRHFSNKKISKVSFKGITQKKKGNFLPTDLTLLNSTVKTIFAKNYNPITKSFLKEFPFGIKLSFDHYHQNDSYKSVLRKLDLMTPMMAEYDQMQNRDKQMVISIPNSLELENETVNYKTVNLIDLLVAAPVSHQRSSSIHYIGDDKMRSSYGNNLRSALLKMYMSTALSQTTTNFLDFMNGAETYSEVLFYKIEKFLGNSSDGKVVQTFYIPADNLYATIFDTQVKKGERYTYSASAVFICVGSKYFLDDTNLSSVDASITIHNKPEVVLMEVPIFEDTVVMSATPLLTPFVHFYTKNNSQNKINIRMNLPIGLKYDDFVTIEDNDALQLSMMNSPRGTQLYPFSYIGTSKVMYDVYRLTSPPKSYEDFQNTKYLENVESNIKDVLNFEDHVRPNQKYYYLFRAVNHYGMKSNPTPIYEVELLKDSDNSKIVVESYRFPEQKVSQQFINMKRLLQIIPAPQHTIFDSTNEMTEKYGESFNNSLDDLKYGIAQKPIWGRKFKIRITSNDTGRKIDVNVLFKLIKKKLNEDLV